MIQRIDAPVDVIFSKTPKKLRFEGREHLITKIGYHHTFHGGRTLFHVFSVASESMFFRLVFNTETLAWRLEEIGDGEVL